MKESTKAIIEASFETWINDGIATPRSVAEIELCNALEEIEKGDQINFESKLLEYVEERSKIAYAAGFEACFKMIMDLR